MGEKRQSILCTPRLMIMVLKLKGILLIFWAAGAGYTTQQWRSKYHPLFSDFLVQPTQEQWTIINRATSIMQATLAFDWVILVVRTYLPTANAPSPLTCILSVIVQVVMLLVLGLQGGSTWTTSIRDMGSKYGSSGVR